MEAALTRPLTQQEYLATERSAKVRSEFFDGRMFAMAGGNRRHSRIKINLISALNGRLRNKPCEVFDSDMRIKISRTGLYTYPDASVACNEIKFEDENEDTLLNPRVLFEVLSESTASYDRGRKFWHYRHLRSLTDFVLISQDQWLVEHYSRQADGGWRLVSCEGKDAIARIRSVGVKIPLAELYRKTSVVPV